MYENEVLSMITNLDNYLDREVAKRYQEQTLAQDWARIGKIIEELGEAINEMILWTGQNPRKGEHPAAYDKMIEELGDVVITAVLAIQHFTKSAFETRDLLEWKLRAIYCRAEL